MDFQEWKDFEGNAWKDEINVRDFIQSNYTPYEEMIASLLVLRIEQKNCGMKF